MNVSRPGEKPVARPVENVLAHGTLSGQQPVVAPPRPNLLHGEPRAPGCITQPPGAAAARAWGAGPLEGAQARQQPHPKPALRARQVLPDTDPG